MSAGVPFIWVNKSRASSSLSNSKTEKDISRRIRSRALVAGHKSSHVNRSIKRVPLNLKWKRISKDTGSLENLRQPTLVQESRCFEPTLLSKFAQHEDDGHSSTSAGKRDLPADRCAIHFIDNGYVLRDFSSSTDPFSCFSVELDVTKLDCLWYFEKIWTQCAFKIPGCVGYGQEPVKDSEVTAMIQQCLSDETRFCCMLAATSARMQYIHRYQAYGNGTAHTYAATALRGLRQKMQKSDKFSEEDSINVLFLAAYEVFCSNESGAGKHLAAIRKLYPREMSNKFVQRLRANLELLVYDTVETNWPQRIDLVVQSR